jgi:acylphosphatase
MADEAIRRRITSHGQVQGVSFRDAVRERARAHGVSGWVCNRGDGAVEAVLEGEPDAVDRVVRFCQTGPPGAQVERTEVEEETPEGLSGFDVR